METASEVIQKVGELERRKFDSLFKRMDEDYDLWDMKAPPSNKYDASIMNKTKAHGSDIEIVSNDLRTFSDDVQSTLSSAEMDIKVRMAEDTGEDKREEIGKLERLFRFAFEKADERLRRLTQIPLRESLAWYGNNRGWIGARVLVYTKNKNVIFDFIPLDPRRLIYQLGGNGLLWTGYKSYRSRDEIKDKYGYDASKDDNNLVIDYWKAETDKKGNITVYNGVVCDDIYLEDIEKRNIPSMPVLIMPVSTRPPIVTDNGNDDLVGYGESLFAPNRQINAVRDRFISMVANHANLMANQAMINYRDEKGEDFDNLANYAGGVMNLPMDHNRLEASPMKEISPTIVNILGWLNGQMAQGMIPKIGMETPTSSGTRYNLAQEASKKIWNPQLRNLNNIYADMCHLIEEQLISNKLKVKVEGQEKDKYYETQVTPVDLKKPHTIKVAFTAVTPWSQQDTAALADMLMRQGIPREWIWENIYKFADPKGLKDQSFIELAENSPEGARYNTIKALENYGRLEEAGGQMMKWMQDEEQEAAQGAPQGAPTEQPPPVQPPPMQGGV